MGIRRRWLQHLFRLWFLGSGGLQCLFRLQLPGSGYEKIEVIWASDEGINCCCYLGFISFFNEISVLLTVGDNDNVWMTLNVIDFGCKFYLVAELV